MSEDGEGRRQILVVGDLTADYVVKGEPIGVAREDGALWLTHREEEFSAGRAGRAAHVVKALGGEPALVGMVGDDVRGAAVLEWLDAQGIATDGVSTVPGLVTPERRRTLLVGPGRDDRLVLRVDREPRGHPPTGASGAILEHVRGLAASADAMLLVDGGHGVASPGVSELYTGFRVVTSQRRITEFREATALVMTDEQAEKAGGRTIASEGATRSVAKEIISRTGAENVVLLRGRLGVALLTIHLEEEVFPTNLRPVTGEEVAMAAAVALALAEGKAMPTAVRYAVERWNV